MPNKERELDFSGQAFYVGIDVHKQKWDVTILGAEYEHKSMSQPASAEVLYNYLHRTFPKGEYHAVYESGFSGFTACRELCSLGVDCIVVHAADVPTSDKERQQKTDRADSRKLARGLREKTLSALDVPSREVESIRALLRQRARVVKDLTRTKSRVKSLLFQFGVSIPSTLNVSSRNWSSRYTTWLSDLRFDESCLNQVLSNYVSHGLALRKELLVISKQIRELSHRQDLHFAVELLLSIPGIGPITAMVIIAELYDIHRFPTLDHLCSFVGLIPRMFNSGDKEKTGRLTTRGRKQLKNMLIESSWIAVRVDPAMMLSFNELTKRMNKNKAIIRIARKMLSRIRYVLIHQEKYEIGVV